MSSHHTKAKQLKSETALLLQIKGLEDNEINLLGIIESRDNELTAIKSDYRKLATLDCRQCTNQEKLVKENKTMFRYLIAMAVIAISALGWAYITWSIKNG